jgi:hypothetical protein
MLAASTRTSAGVGAGVGYRVGAGVCDTVTWTRGTYSNAPIAEYFVQWNVGRLEELKMAMRPVYLKWNFAQY